MWQASSHINRKQFGKFSIVKRCQEWQFVIQKSLQLANRCLEKYPSIEAEQELEDKSKKTYREPGTGRKPTAFEIQQTAFSDSFGPYHYWIFKIFPLCAIILLYRGFTWVTWLRNIFKNIWHFDTVTVFLWRDCCQYLVFSNSMLKIIFVGFDELSKKHT